MFKKYSLLFLQIIIIALLIHEKIPDPTSSTLALRILFRQNPDLKLALPLLQGISKCIKPALLDMHKNL